jgi:hypothetical protein
VSRTQFHGVHSFVTSHRPKRSSCVSATSLSGERQCQIFTIKLYKSLSCKRKHVLFAVITVKEVKVTFDKWLWQNQFSAQKVPSPLSIGVKELGDKADHLSPSSAEIKNML